MKRWQSLYTDMLLVAGFWLLPLLLFASVTLGDQTMLPLDNLFQWEPWRTMAADKGIDYPQNGLLTDLVIENYAWKQFAVNSIHAGDIPLWNPYLFAGAPFLATGQHSMLYPFSWLFLLLPLPKAYGWYTVSQLWLAGALMYMLGRVLGMRRASAFIAGLVYQGSGFLLASAAVFPMIIGAAAWLPALLTCIELVIRDWRIELESIISDRQPGVASQPRFTILWMACGSVALGLQILAGHIEITYYVLLLMGVYAAWRLAYGVFRSRLRLSPSTMPAVFRTSLKAAGWLLAMVFVGLMLGAVQFIPFYEVGQLNFRSGETTLAQVRGYAFPLRRALAFILPNFFGSPAQHRVTDVFTGALTVLPRGTEWGIKNYVEGGAYLGILPLFLVFLSLFALVPGKNGNGIARSRFHSSVLDRRAQTGFFAGMSLLSLAFIFGTPLYALIYYGLPFADQIRTPFRWVFPLSLFVAVLAGFGMDYLAETRREVSGGNREEKRTWASDQIVTRWIRPFTLWSAPSLITGLAGGVFWGGLLLLVGLFASRVAYVNLEPAISKIFHGLALADQAFPDVRTFYSYEFRQFFILGLMLVATGTVLRVSRCPIYVRGIPIWLFMAVIALTLDLFAANVGFHAAVDPALLYEKPDLVQWLQQQPGYWRITSFAPHGDKPFNANSGWLYNLQDIRGYDSIIPKQYVDYMAAIEPQHELPYNRIQPIANWESLNSPLLDVLNVKYIITSEIIDLPKLQLAWEGEGVHVYENLAVAPRAYTLPVTSTVMTAEPFGALAQYDPRSYVVVTHDDWQPPTTLDVPSRAGFYQTAPIDSYGSNEVVVTAVVSETSWLVLNDSYFPGWKVFVQPYGGDETEARITRVNGNFRGVVLPPGQWAVRFRYSPTSFQLGGLLSFMSVIVLLFAGVVWGWQTIVRPDAKLTTTRSIAKNSAAPMVLNLFNKGIDFVFAMFYLRVMGPADSGSFSTAIATAGIFEILSNFGLDILVIREVSKAREQAGHYLLNTTILRLGAAVVASLPMLVLIATTSLFTNPFSRPEILAIAFIMCGMVVSGMSKGVTGLFYVYERAEVPATMTTATTILKVGFGVAALLLGYSFVGLAAVSIFTNIITFCLLAVLAYRSFDLGGAWHVDWGLQRRMVRLGFPLMLIHLLQTVFISVDVYLLRTMLSNGEEVVGWYSSAYKWFNALQIVPSYFTLALFPIISREIERSLAAARRMYQMSLKIMLLLALPIAAMTTFLAYPLVQVLGGNEFLPHGAIALQIVIWSIPVGWLNSVTNYVLIALGLERMQPRAFTIAVGFNIIANALFIPRYSYVAASVTTILSEVVLLAVFAYYLRQKMPGLDWGRLLIRPFLVTLVMVGTMWLGFQVHVLLAVAVGLIVYPLGLWALRVFGTEEQQILRQILPTAVTQRLRFLN